MKTKQITITLFLSLAIFVPALSHAETTISLGGTVWYVWWKPAWADNKWTGAYIYNDVAGYWHEDAHDFKMSSGAMAGPILTIGFLDRWSISTMAVVGQSVFSTAGYGLGFDYFLDTQGITRKEYTRKVLKWDSDTTLGCAVHKYIKLYAGFKAQGYRYKETIHFYDLTGYPDTVIVHMEGTNTVSCYGPGLGIGTTIPLAKDLYMLASLSGIILWCSERADRSLNDSYAFDSAGPIVCYYLMPKGRFMSYGGTASLSLAYTIDPINTTLSLGGRYQLLYNRQKYSNSNPLKNDVTMNIIDGQFDHFAGITFSAIYTFHTGKRG